MLAPLLLLWPMSLVITGLVANDIAAQPYDRALGELAGLVARQVVIVDHGWGSRIFDPRRGGVPESYGANRNLLIDNTAVDPLSQTSPLSSSYVGVERA